MKTLAKHWHRAACAIAVLVATQGAQAGVALGPAMIDLTMVQNDGVEVFDAIAGQHAFGSMDLFDSLGFPDEGYTTIVQSGASSIPGWDFELRLDFTDFGPGFGLPDYPFMDFLIEIEEVGGPMDVTDFAIHTAFGLDFDSFIDFGSAGGTLAFGLDTDDVVANGDVVIVRWSQAPVPAPGAAALLGLAGVVGLRRRRR